MKWLISAFASAATLAALVHGGAAQEPPSGVELVLDETCANAGPACVGTFEIDGLERAVSARAALSTGTSSLQLALPAGLYGVRFVPDPESPAPSVLTMAPAVLLVVPRAVTRVDVRLRVSERLAFPISRVRSPSLSGAWPTPDAATAPCDPALGRSSETPRRTTPPTARRTRMPALE
jgi:hypothetical protein